MRGIWVACCKTFLLVSVVLPYLLYILQPSEADEIFSEDHAMMVPETHPGVLSRHKKTPESKEVIEYTVGERRAIVRKILGTTVQLFSKQGIRLFLQSGSLAGFIRSRDKKPWPTALPWDDDDDLGVMYSDLQPLASPAGSALYQSMQTDFERKHMRMFLTYNNNSDCSVCGRVVHPVSGFFIDIFIWDQGMGKKTRGAKYRGSYKGCWRDGGEDLSRKFVHQRGDFHMFGFDLVTYLEELLPLQKAMYEGAEVWVPADPEAIVRAEYGNCVSMHQPLRVLYLYSALNAFTVSAIGCVLGVGVAVTMDSLVSTHAHSLPAHWHAASLTFTLHGGLVLNMWWHRILRSGFAVVAVSSLYVGSFVQVLSMRTGLSRPATNGSAQLFSPTLTKSSKIVLFVYLFLFLTTLKPLWPIFEYCACFFYQELVLMRPCNGPKEGFNVHG